MNKRQLIALWVGIGLIVLMCLCPPWNGSEYAPLWARPSWRSTIDTSRLGAQCAVVAMLAGGVLFSIRTRRDLREGQTNWAKGIRRITFLAAMAAGTVGGICMGAIPINKYRNAKDQRWRESPLVVQKPSGQEVREFEDWLREMAAQGTIIEPPYYTFSEPRLEFDPAAATQWPGTEEPAPPKKQYVDTLPPGVELDPPKKQYVDTLPPGETIAPPTQPAYKPPPDIFDRVASTQQAPPTRRTFTDKEVGLVEVLEANYEPTQEEIDKIVKEDEETTKIAGEAIDLSRKTGGRISVNDAFRVKMDAWKAKNQGKLYVPPLPPPPPGFVLDSPPQAPTGKLTPVDYDPFAATLPTLKEIRPILLKDNNTRYWAHMSMPKLVGVSALAGLGGASGAFIGVWVVWFVFWFGSLAVYRVVRWVVHGFHDKVAES